jgi:hypothetical protein
MPSTSRSQATAQRNQLLARLAPADFAMLEPHLRRTEMPLYRNIERPHRPINAVFFIETDIASVVAVQPNGTSRV